MEGVEELMTWIISVQWKRNGNYYSIWGSGFRDLVPATKKSKGKRHAKWKLTCNLGLCRGSMRICLFMRKFRVGSGLMG